MQSNASPVGFQHLSSYVWIPVIPLISPLRFPPSHFPLSRLSIRHGRVAQPSLPQSVETSINIAHNMARIGCNVNKPSSTDPPYHVHLALLFDRSPSIDCPRSFPISCSKHIIGNFTGVCLWRRLDLQLQGCTRNLFGSAVIGVVLNVSCPSLWIALHSSRLHFPSRCGMKHQWIFVFMCSRPPAIATFDFPVSVSDRGMLRWDVPSNAYKSKHTISIQ